MTRFSKALRALVFAAFAPLCLVLATPASAQVPVPPEIAARSYLLIDVTANQILAQKDIDTPVEPASLTKLMSAYLVFDALKARRLSLTQTLTVSERAGKMPGSRMFVDANMQVPVEDLIKGMVVQAGNDATNVLAEGVAGPADRFVQMMNDQARALGMKNTQFRNSTGLPDPLHYTTVHDLGILATALVRDFPEYYPTFALKSFMYNKINQPNRDLLLQRDQNVDGMKTGHTESAGYNMVSSSRRDGRRVIAVVVGTDSPEARAAESMKLLNYGLQFYDTPKLYEANKPVSQIKLYKGAEKAVPVGFDRDVYATVNKGQAARLKADLTTDPKLVAPIKAGQAVGKLVVSLDGKPLLERPVVALKEVEQGGFVTRLWDSLKLWLGL